jgi:hypothetical protein
MKLGNPFKMIDKETQKMLLGGLVGSLSYYGDLALSEQSWYPAELKGRVIPQLPRNDELLTSIAPPVAMWMIAKKKPKLKDMATGTMLYSGPHLMQRIVVNAVKPVASTSYPMAFPVMVSAPLPAANKIYPQPVPVATPSVPSVAAGKYR